MAALPSHLGSGLITGHFARWVVDGDDADRDPDIQPETGLEITLTAEVLPKTPLTVINFPRAYPATTYIAEPIVVTTNSEGVLVDPSGAEGVRVVSNESTGSIPEKWFWRAVVRRRGALIAEKTFSVPLNGTVDLTSVIPVIQGTPVPGWWAELNAIKKMIENLGTLPTNPGTPGGGSGGQVGVAPAVSNTPRVTKIAGGSNTGPVTDISDIAVGSFMVLAVIIGSSTADLTTPAGWTVLKAQVQMGTRRVALYGRTKLAGDATVKVTPTIAGYPTVSILVHGTGAKAPELWTPGTFQVRAANSNDVTAVPVQAALSKSLVLTFAFEATNALEGNPVSIVGAQQLGFVPQDNSIGTIETIWVGKVDKPAPGPTDYVTVSYLNTSASTNGGAMQLVIPPMVEDIEDTGEGPGGIDEVDGLRDALNSRWRKWKGTQAEYDALPVKSDDYLYAIVL
jgi:hypothetical protein